MRLIHFFGDVGREMKAVSWPTRKELRHDTGTVVGMTVFFAAFFAIVDNGLQWLLNLLVSK
ncbi:preprotein translocase subunit SecE [Loigolactobacillus backii]|uniref:preprotein translocase subunit SecE n=1 Tax=Loigolactobacillus backii TaxID=375175 RepID=UPI000C1C9956|nr:preprotein translocase subunit SecE [Loigolactobacillus backii]PIO82984.1 preprotein translocase subunit SecE [Loigolactobacillus backii]